jgi:hypothetical protein
MTTRTIAFPAHLLRWLFAPGPLTVLVANLSALFRRRRQRVNLPPMSDEWLNNLSRRTHSDPWSL